MWNYRCSGEAMMACYVNGHTVYLACCWVHANDVGNNQSEQSSAIAHLPHQSFRSRLNAETSTPTPSPYACLHWE